MSIPRYRRRQIGSAMAALEDAAQQLRWALEEERSDADRSLRCALAVLRVEVARVELRRVHRHYARVTGREPLL